MGGRDRNGLIFESAVDIPVEWAVLYISPIASVKKRLS